LHGRLQNYSSWHSEHFNTLVDQIDREVDPQNRLAESHTAAGLEAEASQRLVDPASEV
jgi:hypothetical protein